MAGMGPPPKDPTKRARRNATVAMTKLPAAGRKGPAPAWPLLPDVGALARLKCAEESVTRLRGEWSAEEDARKARALAKRLETAEVHLAEAQQHLDQHAELEKSVWTDLWKTPQATAWEQMHWTREVAQYVRWKVRAELGSLDASKEARQLADRLGLSPLAMLRLRWAVAEDEVGQRREQKGASGPNGGARSRRGPLRSVPQAPKAAGDG